MISFIILHYKNINDTCECIQSIKQLSSHKKISIVVVDNHSLSIDDEVKIKSYTKDLIKLDDNIGFAKANNIGCKYAIEKYNPDFLCVINNDTIIRQLDFIDEIYRCYDETKFDILGPKIITDNGDSVNPFNAYQTVQQIDDKIVYHNKLIKIYNNNLLRLVLDAYLYIKTFIFGTKHLSNGEKSQFDVALHGCALIFSKKYYERFEHVFYNDTFLYHEEEFLDYRRRKYNLITFYDCNLSIFHKEGSSLNLSFSDKKKYQKLIFRNKEIIKSLEKLRDVIVNDKNI